MNDWWYLERYAHSTYILATGWDDQCLGANQYLSRQMGEKWIPHKLYVWDSFNSHDWPTWGRMMNEYL
jgi:esterase/lipase superfamily enzyme